MSSTNIASMPWPAPVRCGSKGDIAYQPRVGNTARRFDSMAQASDYETGVFCRRRGAGLLDDASAATRQGWLDEDARLPSITGWSAKP
jgi:hypothetical protein